ncbi:monovalent cation/H+ antiporter subunit D [Rhizobacter sp. Root1221]|uniref:monovalent cation/H+ antiporter subunit D n=1 Tax=Rhizobacter sp. Root1221 TaxID=1736433 RepID=UPI0006F62FF5|nr:monovalent cation/H+ antiporter subunit D [Rhizobacter sp. Root1221]KQV78806.1 cation:proton antiporter [Rhizobacter sp. Root1221]
MTAPALQALAPGLWPHLIVAPLLLPMLTAAAMLLLGEKRRRIKGWVNIASTFTGLVMAVMLLRWVDRHGVPGVVGVYLPSNWDVPYGIVLAADRLSALMLVLAGIVALGALLFAVARWDRAGVHFHPLFQIQLMGLYGAFLTADLFNLFVFFEVMLAASYGLMLHGSGRQRVSAGLHYVAINLVASSFFLIGAAMIYGVTGTLNFADLAVKIPHIPADDRGLLHAGAAILATAFLAKAAMWPMNAWLEPAYSAASAPVAGLFAIMTKVGVYAVLRLWTLLFSDQAGASAQFGGPWLVVGGLVTVAFGSLGMLGAKRLARLASFSVLISSGTLLAAIGFGRPALTGGALYYLASSTLSVSAFFLLAELVERSRVAAGDKPEGDTVPGRLDDGESNFDSRLGANLDEEEELLIGRAIPAAMAFLGLSFIACTLLLSGMPPLSGFIGKLAILTAVLDPLDGPTVPRSAWALVALMVGSGLVSMIALSRAGIRHFWAPQDRPAPRLRVIECLPIGLLVLACCALVVNGDALVRYGRATAESLQHPTPYIDAVTTARPAPSPSRMPEGIAP